MKEMLRQQRDFQRGMDITQVKETPGASGWSAFYDFGSFTPSLIGSTIAGTFTYSIRNGLWTRTGNVVFVTGHIAISAIAVSPTGNLQIGTLPITPAATDPGTLNLSDQTGITITAGRTQVGIRVLAGSTLARLVQSGSGVGGTVVQGSQLALVGGAAEFVFSGSYQV